MSPSLDFIRLSLGYLCSDEANTVELAVKLLRRWLDRGAHIGEAPVVEALCHWGERKKPTHSAIRDTAVDSLKELLDSIVSKNTATAVAQ